MIKKLFTIGIMAMAALGINAQTPLPLNPEVRHGQLPNGLNYYILHNEEPKERVNFYIAQKVGSTLETPEQLGLAHFLEHMAFNGTKNYPGNKMLSYLQSKGIRFGNDINAYTGFDETVYNIDNVPSSDKALVDSVLLCLYDWSGSILLEEEEINKERGVIEEEWRSRNSANQRMYEAILPLIYEEYQYEQMPIGKMEIVRNFPPQAIRDYYKKWYRPDQQGIVIVGDIDAAEMEEKVKKLFSTIPMPENAAERVYTPVSDNTEPIYAYFQDKELQYPMVRVSFKSDKTPKEYRNTVESYMADDLLENLISTMINNRLTEYSQKPECKYAYAAVMFGDFMVSSTKGTFDIVVIAKDDVMAAYNDALALVAQACKTGFMQSELVRARDEMLAGYEKLYNERKNTKSATLARELIRHFIDNEPSPGVEKEYELVQQVLPMLSVEMINPMLSQLLTSNNQVIVVSQPETPETVAITKEQAVGALNNALNAQYEAYVDEVITDPLIEKLPAPGKIAKEQAGKFETIEYTLSNGARVILKPTDFKADEVFFTAYKEGGRSLYAPEQANEVILIDDIYNYSKLGKFDSNKLQKYLAGKKVALSYTIANTVTDLEGSSTVKDLPTLMELIYASFTDLNPDPETFGTQMEQAKTLYRNMDKNPNMVFNKRVSKDSYNGNPLYATPDLAMIEAVNYEKGYDIIRKSLANAADYTFIFTGNVDPATMKPLIEQYIATLPSTGKCEAGKVAPIGRAKGIIKDTFKQPMQVPATMIFTNVIGTNLPYNVENAKKIELIGDILEIIYTETLREEEGGTYSPYAGAAFNPSMGEWNILYTFQTNAKQQDAMIKRANDEFTNLLNNGAPEAAFNKAKEAMLKQLDINERSNKYWDSNIMLLARGIDNVTGERAAIEGITLQGLNDFMKKLYDGKNFLQVVMEGVEETAAN